MKIDATVAIDHPMERYAFDVQGIPDGWASSLGVVLLESVHIRGEYWSEKGNVHVKGTIAARLEVPCSRCLTPVEHPLQLEAEGIFSHRQDDAGEVYELEGKQLLLDKFILDEISLALPSQYLCTPDCKGLCPKCGVNRNFEACDCDISSNGLNPFEQLKDLF